MTRLEFLALEGNDCYNCVYSHWYGDQLKCSLNAKTEDSSDYKVVDEYDIRACWAEER